MQKPLWMRPMIVGRNPKWTLVRVIILVMTCFFIFKFVLIPIRIVGPSMEPNYHNGRWNFVNKLAYRNADPQRGDVVAVRWMGEQVMLCKRIIGLQGELIQLRPPSFGGEVPRAGGIYVNNQLLFEDYVRKSVDKSWYFRRFSWWSQREWSLAKDQYLVIGDNRSMRIYDHTFGVVPKGDILGKVLF